MAAVRFRLWLRPLQLQNENAGIALNSCVSPREASHAQTPALFQLKRNPTPKSLIGYKCYSTVALISLATGISIEHFRLINITALKINKL